MKKFALALAAFGLASLVACGGSSSSSDDDDESSSSVAASSSSGSNDDGASGDLVSCQANIEGVLGENSCVEVSASSDFAASLKTICAQMVATNTEGMTYTAGTSCNAPDSALKCTASGANMYSMDGKYTDCKTFLSESMFSGIVTTLQSAEK